MAPTETTETTSDPAKSATATISAHRPHLQRYEDLYRHLHAHPELSFQEAKTAETVRDWLSKYSSPSYEITSGIGGHGLVAVLKNGAGPTIMLRADMDALPVLERTGLPYASKARMKDAAGVEQPVMHACGHDMHITSLLAAAELLRDARTSWSGTLVVLFQPAEEKGAGARAMVEDGLYTKYKVPIPDIVLGGHVTALRAGAIAARAGAVASACDSYKVTLHGRGAHASMPQSSIDPVVMAASTVMRLQTLVSRESAPMAGNVVTVASVRAGEAENVIPDTAELKVDVRSFDEQARKRLLAGIRRVVRHESLASGAEKEPTFETLREFPLLYNNEEVTEAVSKSLEIHFGDAWDGKGGMLGASEDFGVLATSVEKPSCFWIYGGTDREVYDQKKSEGRLHEDVPSNHSALFAPVVQPTLQVAVDTYAVAALTFLGKE